MIKSAAAGDQQTRSKLKLTPWRGRGTCASRNEKIITTMPNAYDGNPKTRGGRLFCDLCSHNDGFTYAFNTHDAMTSR